MCVKEDITMAHLDDSTLKVCVNLCHSRVLHDKCRLKPHHESNLRWVIEKETNEKYQFSHHLILLPQG